MKNSILKRGVLWGAVIALVTAAGLALRAEDKAPDRPPLTLQTDHQAINRDDSLRVSYASVVKKASPSVVYVFSTKIMKQRQDLAPFFNDPMFRRFFGVPDQGQFQPQEQRQQGLGSGVIISKDGYILTNNHVVDGADEVKVAFGEPRQEFKATVVGRDSKADIAVLKIDTKDLPAATLGDSDALEVGDTVFAIGNPFGIGMTVTQGIVRALGRSGLGIETYEDFIQTDAAINPGNSGGALVDAQGRVIGINTAILSRSGGFNGVGFAIPINFARSLAEQLVSTGKIRRGFMGVSTQSLEADLAAQFGAQHGALVTDVTPDSPADKAGLKSGDIITKVNGQTVADPRRLQFAVIRLAPGTEVTVEYLRDKETKTATFKLGELDGKDLAGGASADSDEGVLDGVAVTDLTPQLRAQMRIPDRLEGALVSAVDPSTPSARDGLREGDVILSLDRRAVRNAEEAVKLSEEIKGPKVLVRIWREGISRYLVVDESE
ncbi:MAG: DegQ family serine endoprotease [Opitutaceae bacterium]|nr:DegQ family serine endoprotease [Opitutaceae bacterium]